MYLAYIDESGSSGHVTAGGSHSYTLGCVLVRATQWSMAANGLTEHRRQISERFSLLMSAEVKANHLLRNSGAFRELGLSERARRRLYRDLLQLCPRLGLMTLAIVVKKEETAGRDPHVLAWSLLLLRLEQLTSRHGTQIVLVHDQGDERRVCALARRARQEGMTLEGVGLRPLHAPFLGLLDDPVSRDSKQSLFLQLADLVAYAAFRRVFPPPPRDVQIVPATMWSELGTSRLAEIGEPSNRKGIVVWPAEKRKSPCARGSLRADLHRLSPVQSTKRTVASSEGGGK